MPSPSPSHSAIENIDHVVDDMIEQLQTLKHQVAEEHQEREESLRDAQAKIHDAQEKAQDAAEAAQAATHAAQAALAAVRKA